MYDAKSFLAVILFGCVSGVSNVILLIPLLYIDDREKRVIYGVLMTVVLTMVGCLLYFFQVIRPIYHFSRTMKKIKEGFDVSSKKKSPSEDAWQFSFTGNNHHCNYRHVDWKTVLGNLDEERDQVEKVLQNIHMGMQLSCNPLQWHRETPASLLVAVLEWQESVIQACRGRLEEHEKMCSNDSLYRQNSSHHYRSNSGGAYVQEDRGGNLPSLKQYHYDGNNNNNNNNNNNCDHQREEVKVKEENREKHGEIEMDTSKDLAPFSSLSTETEEAVGREKKKKISVHEEDIFKERIVIAAPGEENTTSSKTNSDKPSTASSHISHVHSTKKGGKSFHDNNNNNKNREGVKGENAAVFSSAKGSVPPLPDLRRGSRFPTDNDNVFFYVTVKRHQTPDVVIIGFEALLDDDNNNNNDNNSGLSNVKKDLNLREEVPFQGFLVDEKGRRVSLEDHKKVLYGFLTCEIEPERNMTAQHYQEEMTQKYFSSSERENVSMKTTKRSFILSWAPLPDMPIRLTILPVNLSRDECCMLPVLECLVNDVFCIMTTAVVYAQRSDDGSNHRGLPQSVRLHGVSIEDNSGEDEGVAGTDSAFGMPISENITLRG